jgi:pSer/pThr/pTyr-binding forkhead associated (FHA) protein
VTSGPSTGTEVELTEFGRAYVIGRGKGVDLNLDDPDLSRRHVQVQRRGDRILVTDLGSKNGSRLAGEPLAPNQETPWPLGAPLEAGAHAVSCENPVKEALEELERAADEKIRDEELIDPPTSSSEEPASAPAPQLAARPRGKPAKARTASAETPSGWSATDFMVALLAVAVFAVSLLGLWWIARQ